MALIKCMLYDVSADATRRTNDSDAHWLIARLFCGLGGREEDEDESACERRGSRARAVRDLRSAEIGRGR